MALEREIETYNRMLPELLVQHEGRYVTIVGDVFVGVFAERGEALTAGYMTCGSEGFLCRQILVEQPVRHLPTMLRITPTDQSAR